MELELEGGTVEVSGNVEIELPDYMVMLVQEELDEARRAQARDEMIIAAGRKPDCQEIVVMTATGRLLVLDGAKHGLPEGHVIPTDHGHAVAIEHEGYCEVTSDWVIANADAIDISVLTT
jgi:hypothetical protein